MLSYWRRRKQLVLAAISAATRSAVTASSTHTADMFTAARPAVKVFLGDPLKQEFQVFSLSLYNDKNLELELLPRDVYAENQKTNLGFLFLSFFFFLSII